MAVRSGLQIKFIMVMMSVFVVGNIRTATNGEHDKEDCERNNTEQVMKATNALLLEAAKKGDDKGVRQALEKGADIEVSEGAHKFRPLILAAMHGHTSVVKTLLDNKAHVNVVHGLFCDTSLKKACQGGYSDIVRLLLKADAQVNAGGFFGETPLIIAAFKGHGDIVAQLLAKKAAVNGSGAIVFKRSMPLIKAAYGGNAEVVRILLDNKADMSVTYKGNTALMIAAHCGHIDTVQLLLDRNADVDINKKNRAGATALMESVLGKHASVARMLVLAGAIVDSIDKQGRAPLSVAQPIVQEAISAAQKDKALLEGIRAGNERAVRAAIEGGADVNVRGWEGERPLIEATREGHEALVRLLLEKKADIEGFEGEGVNGYRRNALYWAATLGYTGIAQLLLDNKANSNVVCQAGWTPLAAAAIQGKTSVVELLLAHNADSNAINDKSETPLRLAAYQWLLDQQEKVNTARMLVLAGADVAIADKKGKTALDIAKPDMKAAIEVAIQERQKLLDEKHREEIQLVFEKQALEAQKAIDCANKRLFEAIDHGDDVAVREALAAGAQVNRACDFGWKPLHCAAQKGYVQVVKTLLDYNALVDMPAKSCNTSLMEAARHGHTEVAQVLIDHKAHIHALNKYDSTPLLWAATHGGASIMQLLLENKADVNRADVYGTTPLMAALMSSLKEGSQEAALMLVAAGADVTFMDEQGQTALDRASPVMREALEAAIQEKEEGGVIEYVNGDGGVESRSDYDLLSWVAAQCEEQAWLDLQELAAMGVVASTKNI